MTKLLLEQRMVKPHHLHSIARNEKKLLNENKENEDE